jgi:hypothetical protein
MSSKKFALLVRTFWFRAIALKAIGVLVQDCVLKALGLRGQALVVLSVLRTR